MLSETVVTVFFRLLNFFVLIAISAYIFKRYFRTSIEEAIKQKKLEEINFGNHIRELEQRSKNLSEEIVRQEQLCEYLIDRTAQWQEAFEEQTKKQLKEQKELAIKNQLRMDRQAENLEQERILKAVVPMAIEQTSKKLEESYSNQLNNEHFVDNIITFMKKSS